MPARHYVDSVSMSLVREEKEKLRHSPSSLIPAAPCHGANTDRPAWIGNGMLPKDFQYIVLVLALLCSMYCFVMQIYLAKFQAWRTQSWTLACPGWKAFDRCFVTRRRPPSFEHGLWGCSWPGVVLVQKTKGVNEGGKDKLRANLPEGGSLKCNLNRAWMARWLVTWHDGSDIISWAILLALSWFTSTGRAATCSAYVCVQKAIQKVSLLQFHEFPIPVTPSWFILFRPYTCIKLIRTKCGLDTTASKHEGIAQPRPHIKEILSLEFPRSSLTLCGCNIYDIPKTCKLTSFLVFLATTCWSASRRRKVCLMLSRVQCRHFLQALKINKWVADHGMYLPSNPWWSKAKLASISPSKEYACLLNSSLIMKK